MEVRELREFLIDWHRTFSGSLKTFLDEKIRQSSIGFSLQGVSIVDISAETEFIINHA